ncbi:MAG: NADH-quinone oxidoreductase subunit C [Actinomycetota bacterium]
MNVPADQWRDMAIALKQEGWLCVDLCGVDRVGLPDGAANRFEIVVQLLHESEKKRLTIHVAAAGDAPSVSSVVDVWPTVNFMEREAYVMFGINFEGHPNQRRILMPDEWEGHPLRKDYGVGKVPLQFVEQPMLQIDTPGQAPDRDEAGVGVDRLGQLERAATKETE